MTANIINKKSGLELGKLSAIAQIAIKPVAHPADAEVDLRDIYSDKQIRKAFRNLEALAESFRLNGIIEPLIVHKETNGRYRIIAGERRFRAAPLAELTKVPVIIKANLTELQIRRLQVAENNDRDSLTAYEEAMGVIEDVEQYGIPETTRIWNRGAAWVSKRIAVQRYADDVRELLEHDLCGDFEVLHCLNQIYNIEGNTHIEFMRFVERIKDGLPLSRNEVRNTFNQMKDWKRQQNDSTQYRIDLDNNQQDAQDVKQDDAEINISDESSQADQEAAFASGVTWDVSWANRISTGEREDQQNFLPALEPTSAEKIAAKEQDASKKLLLLREEILKIGATNQTQFSSMKTCMAALSYDMHQTEWVLWQGFLAIILPTLKGIGSKRAIMYLKKLQDEVKDKTLKMDVPGVSDMPEGWRL